MDESVEDRVSEGWIADNGVPPLQRQLSADDAGAFVVAVVEEFQEIATFRELKRGQEPFIQDD